jgi:hypothetical protein
MTREEAIEILNNALLVNKGITGMTHFLEALELVLKLLEQQKELNDVIGSCECGKYPECCRKIHSNSDGKMWIATDEHFRCGKVQKQILDMKEWWDNNYR